MCYMLNFYNKKAEENITKNIIKKKKMHLQYCKRSAYKWTCLVQISIVQESTVLFHSSKTMVSSS